MELGQPHMQWLVLEQAVLNPWVLLLECLLPSRLVEVLKEEHTHLRFLRTKW
jgi:hypothetical protein